MSNDVDEALKRARAHFRSSILEGLEGTRALLQATVHASGLTDVSKDSMVGQVERQLEDLIAVLRDSAAFTIPRALAEPLQTAIDAEINRWEQRSRTDPDARLVLRAFLGMRELLWEVGMRSDGATRAGGSRTSGVSRSTVSTLCAKTCSGAPSRSAASAASLPARSLQSSSSPTSGSRAWTASRQAR